MNAPRRDAAAYTLAEASRYLRLPAATLRSWVLGRRYATIDGAAQFRPLIRAHLGPPPLLSFSNLIEAHVLRSLRTDHGVSVQALRNAVGFAEEKLGIDRLLLREDLRTNAGRVFLDRYGELIELSASGQLAMRRLLAEHLERVVWDTSKFPARLYPFVSTSAPTDRTIIIDPTIAFGRPVVQRKGISTAAITERLDAGETVDALADDYDLNAPEIEQAALYERAAA